jgi:hypothetical protein
VPLRAARRGTRLPTTALGRAETEETVKLDRSELVLLLHTQGENEQADKVEQELPEEIDTDRDGDQLDALGLDRTQLMAKLAAGGFGGTIAP